MSIILLWPLVSNPWPKTNLEFDDWEGKVAQEHMMLEEYLAGGPWMGGFLGSDFLK